MNTGFFVGCNIPMWADLILALRRSDIRFSYICGLPEVTARLGDGTTILHDLVMAERGVGAESISTSDAPPLDAVTLKKYQQAEIACLDIADRMDLGYTFAYRERERLYFTCLEFWLAATQMLKPDFVLFPDNPHSVFSHTLFHVCRQKHIPMLSFLHITALKLIIPVADFEQENPKLRAAFNSMQQEHADATADELLDLLPTRLREYVETHELNYDHAMPAYLKSRLEANKVKGSLLGNTTGADVARRLLQPLGYPKLFKTVAAKALAGARNTFNGAATIEAPLNFLKRPYEALENSFISGSEWRQYKNRAISYKTDLLTRYNSLCEPPELDKPYILFPLHYQPERTTSPEGGRFSNQQLVLKMLSRHLPDGWHIIVKENPTQLLSHTAHGERGRLPYFYDDLVSIDRVSLVPMEISQFDLIDSARAVASLTGTTGFEAVIRGKPVLVFGFAWYRGCNGTFFVQNNDELNLAIEQIVDGAKPDLREVFLFMLALGRIGMRGFVNPKRARPSEQELAENIENLKNLALKNIL